MVRQSPRTGSLGQWWQRSYSNQHGRTGIRIGINVCAVRKIKYPLCSNDLHLTTDRHQNHRPPVRIVVKATADCHVERSQRPLGQRSRRSKVTAWLEDGRCISRVWRPEAPSNQGWKEAFDANNRSGELGVPWSSLQVIDTQGRLQDNVSLVLSLAREPPTVCYGKCSDELR